MGLLSGFSGPFLALLATTAISVVPNVLLYLIPVDVLSQNTFNGINAKKIMLAFACGGLLGDVFLHTLPHLLGVHHHEDLGHHHGGGVMDRLLGHLLEDEEKKPLLVASNLLLGFLGFFVLERVMTSHDFGGHVHDHSKKAHKESPRRRSTRSRSQLRSRSSTPSERTKSSKTKEWLRGVNEAVAVLKSRLGAQGWLNLAADSLHNFTDGLALGASFSGHGRSYGNSHGGSMVGVATGLSVLLHEVPHEIGDFTVLVSQGLTKQEAIQAQFVTAIGAFLGTLCGLWGASGDKVTEALLLAWTAGGFLYIATAGMVPAILAEDRSESKLHVLYDAMAFITGCMLMLAVALLE